MKNKKISKSELLEAYYKMKAEQLQREREAIKSFRIFSATDDWVYIAEWIGKELKVIRWYKFQWYDMYKNAIFDFKEELIPVK